MNHCFVAAVMLFAWSGCQPTPRPTAPTQAAQPSATSPATTEADSTDSADDPSRPAMVNVSEQQGSVPSPQAASGVSRHLQPLHDDWPAALRQAQQQDKLIFVDVGAEWCHTCLSMQSYVFTDPSLVPFESSFVFVELDTDNPKNEDFLQRFEVDVWPTFFVIDPSSQSLLGYWPGAGSLQEMKQLLQDSLETARAIGGSAQDPFLASFMAARLAQSEGRTKDALGHFERAYRAMPPDWPRRGELYLGYVRTLMKAGQFQRCAQLGEQHLADVSGVAVPIQLAQRTFACLGQLKTSDRAPRVQRVLQTMRNIAYVGDPQMSYDDRADAMGIFAKALAQTGDTTGAAAVQRDRLTLVEQAAAEATTPEQERTFDSARAKAYVALGRPQDAIRLLEARQRQFPTSVSPGVQLADVYQSLDRLTDASAALAYAIERAEGQSKATLLQRRAAIFARLGDTKGQAEALRASLAVLETSRGASAKRQADAVREQLRRTSP